MVDKSQTKDVTRLLADLRHGDKGAESRLLEAVYHELHQLAQSRMRGERLDHTLQPTALVHEAYMRLLGEVKPEWDNRAHFFGAAAEAMRRILVDHARRKTAAKRGGGAARSEVPEELPVTAQAVEEILAVEEVLARLEAEHAQKAEVVKLRFFAGCTVEETAAILNVSPRTVKRDWAFARAWLYREIHGERDRPIN